MNRTWIIFRPSFASLGGVETIIYTLVDKLVLRNDKIIIVSGGANLPAHGLENHIVISHNWGSNTKSLMEILRKEVCNETTILSFDPLSMALAFSISTKLATWHNPIRIACGVFHPRDFKRENEKWHIHKLNWALGRIVGLDKLYFMNEPCRSAHLKVWSDIPVLENLIPLPTEVHPVLWARVKDANRLRICSVGRIVPFKTYNFSCLEIISEFKDREISLVWEIFGHGSHVDDLLALLSQNHGGQITYKGSLPPESFNDKVSDFDLFIGMGLAAIQASMLGVPTICAIEGSRDECIGYFHEVPFGVVGENVEGSQRCKINKKIDEYIESNQSDRANISLKGREAAMRYSVDRYISDLDDFAIHIRNSLWQRLKGKLAFFYVTLVADSHLRRIISKIKRQVVVK